MRSPVWSTARSALVVFVVALCATAAAASPAVAAPSAWWHLTSRSRPTYLQPGKATDDVQEVQVSGTEGLYALAAQEGFNSGHFALLSSSATPGEVQQKLEATVFEPGTIEVKAASAPAGAGAYRITFIGSMATQAVGLMEVIPLGPTVSVKRVTKGRPDGVIVVDATNLGDANVNPAGQPVTIADALPPGVTPVGIEGTAEDTPVAFAATPRIACSLAAVSCTFTGERTGSEIEPLSIAPYQQIEMRIEVNLTGAQSGAISEASVTGGGTPPATVRWPLTVSSAPAGFGVSSYELRPEEEGGRMDTQAGSHPFQLTTTLMLNETIVGRPPAMAKDLHFQLPPGVIGNPEPFARCTLAQFYATDCPSQTVVGVARIYARAFPRSSEPEPQGGSGLPMAHYSVELVNLEPQTGEPARFGFMIEVLSSRIPVFLDTAVRTGGDYGVTVDVSNITEEAELLGSEVTFWGVPGDERHNESRGTDCLVRAVNDTTGGGGVPCPGLEAHNPPPLLSLPTSCTGALQTSVESDSWADPGVFGSVASSEPLPAMDGCNLLPFTPSIRVTPDGTQASKPTGLNVDVHVPQELVLSAAGLAESEVRSITVALPEGVAINPASGDGLEACPDALVGFEGFRELSTEPGVQIPTFSGALPGSPGSSEALRPGLNFCGNASKIGTVVIHTPLLPNALEGAVYLGAQEANPFGSLVAMYIVAQDPVSGTVVKLPGVVHLMPSGQIVATFEDTPQLPFEDAELHFFGGERAPLASPAKCGAYTTQAQYTPWSGAGAVQAASTSEVTSGPNGSPCPGASLPFSPSLTAGTTSIQAGGFSPFTMTMSREDGSQDLSSIELRMPPGLSGTLANVKLCPEPQADEGTCPEDSLIGETTVSVGVGGNPYTVKGGKVYITGAYKGAPFGLSIVNPAKAGPFDLEKTLNKHPACDCLVVRAKIEVDPVTAALTITSNPPGSEYSIPTIIEGIPLQIKHVNVTINHLEDFTFNPTNCNKMAITGTLLSAEGSSDQLSVPFQVTDCATLSFKPQFGVSTEGKTSRADGASLTATLTYPDVGGHSILATGQANIAKVKVELPKLLPSRLSTLQKACTAKTFDTNPALCPAASMIGSATATTPLLPEKLTGPAYFVSNGNARFPELIIVLQGYGVTVDLHGETFISKEGITSSTFATVPDVPVGTFQLTLPEGPHSALAASGSLCGLKLVMPTEFVAQDGDVIRQSIPIEVTGCKPAIRIVHHKKKAKGKKAKGHNPKGKKTKGHMTSITVAVPSAGRLTATAAGLSSANASVARAGEVTVTLALTRSEEGMLARHPGHELAAHIKLRFTSDRGERLSSSTTVILG